MQLCWHGNVYVCEHVKYKLWIVISLHISPLSSGNVNASFLVLRVPAGFVITFVSLQKGEQSFHSIHSNEQTLILFTSICVHVVLTMTIVTVEQLSDSLTGCFVACSVSGGFPLRVSQSFWLLCAVVTRNTEMILGMLFQMKSADSLSILLLWPHRPGFHTAQMKGHYWVMVKLSLYPPPRLISPNLLSTEAGARGVSSGFGPRFRPNLC